GQGHRTSSRYQSRRRSRLRDVVGDRDDLRDVRILGSAGSDGDGDSRVRLTAGAPERLGVGRVERAARPGQEESWPDGEAVLRGTVGPGQKRDDLRVGAGLSENLVQGGGPEGRRSGRGE